MTGVADAADRLDVTLQGIGGEYMDSAVVTSWLAREGEHVAEGQVIAVVETAKAATDVTAPADGVLSAIHAREGDEVSLGGMLCSLRIGVGAAAGRRVAEGPIPVAVLAPERGDRGLPRRWPPAFASPLAKRMAMDRGIDLSRMTGSGPLGRIVRADVARMGEGRQTEAAAPRADTFAMSVDCDAAALMEARARIWERGGRATLGNLAVLAIGRALARHRHLSGGAGGIDILLGQDATDRMTLRTIRGLDRMSADALATAAATVGAPGSPDPAPHPAVAVIDLSGSGISAFAPPLHPPATLALAVPAPCDIVRFSARRLESHAVLRIALVADARAVDCVQAARFLEDLRGLVEHAAPGDGR